MPDALAPLIEALSAQLHAIYQQEAHRQGYDVRHTDAYDSLPEQTKDYDRVLAQFIVRHANAATIAAMLADPLDGDIEGHPHAE